MAKSHETRQFSYMQVVDGPIVTFSLLLDIFLLFWGKEENKKNCQTLPDDCTRSELYWRIGEFTKLVKKGILPLNHVLTGLGY